MIINSTEIQNNFGKLQVEHVGSTSVPGLCAKPFIDIVLVVPESADEQSYLPNFEKN